MLKGNKGEWSEIYTLLKLLGDKGLHVGDKNLKKIPNILYPIIKIIRNENQEQYEYHIDDEIKLFHNNDEILSISLHQFTENAQLLLNKIQENTQTTFEIPEINSFLSKIKCQTLKAKSSVKTDIRIVIHDLKTNQLPELGFSIKSQLGNPSTLLNPGKTTNFIYKIESDLTPEKLLSINTISGRRKIRDRMDKLDKNKVSLTYHKTERELFNNNLVLIDSLMPNIISELLKLFYSTDTSKVSELVSMLENINPLNFDMTHNHHYYQYKIKKFLTEVAVGMMPATVWQGIYDATGGYLVVKEDGDILAYHLYNRNEFEDYLFYQTKLDTASTKRFDFGNVFELNNSFFMKLNLQIRFLK